jgi:hypothetical protein
MITTVISFKVNSYLLTQPSGSQQPSGYVSIRVIFTIMHNVHWLVAVTSHRLDNYSLGLNVDAI